MVKKIDRVAAAIRDEKFGLKKRSVLAPLHGIYSRELGRHEFALNDAKEITHTIDGKLCATINQAHWEDYVRSNEAAAVACEWVDPEMAIHTA